MLFNFSFCCFVGPFSGEPTRRHHAPFPSFSVPFKSWHIQHAQLVEKPARQRPGFSPSSTEVTASSCRFSVLHLSQIQLTAPIFACLQVAHARAARAHLLRVRLFDACPPLSPVSSLI
jgi:hypothetical protein